MVPASRVLDGRHGWQGAIAGSVTPVNGWEFAASLISSLAWPVVAVLAVVTLRKPIAKMLASTAGRPLIGLKIGPTGVEASWAGMADVEETANSLRTGQSPGDAEREDVADMLAMAKTYPAGAVMMAFERLRTVLVQVLKGRDLAEDGERLPPSTIVQRALAGKVISPEVAESIRTLQQVNTQVQWVGSGEVVTPERAAQYVRLTDSLVQAILR